MSFVISHSRPRIELDDVAAVLAVLNDRAVGDGATVESFRSALQTWMDAPYGVHITATGAHGIAAALKSVGVRAGDDVILPTYVCHEVRDAILSVGANPIYCDVDCTWRMTVEAVSAVWTTQTKAIILVSPFGLCTSGAEFRRFGVPLVSDCCQAFDICIPKYEPNVDRGDVFVASFHATKCLTTGRGGAVVAMSGQFADRLHEVVAAEAYLLGFTDLQAALGLSQLEKYDEFRRRRAAIFEAYRLRLPKWLTDQIAQARAASPPFRFVVRQSRVHFEEAQERFAAKGISIRRGVDDLLHRRASTSDAEFPGALRCFEETISLPSYASLSKVELESVITSALEIFGSE